MFTIKVWRSVCFNIKIYLCFFNLWSLVLNMWFPPGDSVKLVKSHPVGALD